MASTFQVSDILADVARMANVPAFTTSTNVTLTTATYWLVQSARSLSALLRQKLGEDSDFLSTATLTVQAGLGLASLPTNCGELNAVLWTRTSSDLRLLRPANLDDLEDGVTVGLQPWVDTTSPRYRLEGETLVFYPVSSVAETVVLFYSTHLDLTAQTSFSARLDADRWMTLDVTCRVLQAQGRDASIFLQDKLLLEQNLLSSGRRRDPHATHTIRDTRSARIRSAIRGRW